MASLFSRLKKGLSRSRESLAQLIPGRSSKTYSDEVWQDVEDALIMADCGREPAMRLVQQTRKSRKDLLEEMKSGMLKSLPAPTAINQPG